MPQVMEGVDLFTALLAIPAFFLLASIALPAIFAAKRQQVAHVMRIIVIAIATVVAVAFAILMASGVITDIERGMLGLVVSALLAGTYAWAGDTMFMKVERKEK